MVKIKSTRVYSSKRQLDPEGIGLALWRPASFLATTMVLNDLEHSISTLLPLKISSVLVAWQPLQCNLRLTTGCTDNGKEKETFFHLTNGKVKAELHRVSKDSH